MCKLSFIIPMYNEEERIERCINSILKNKSSENVEIIVIDDCSSDNSVKIIKELQKNNRNIYLYQNDSQQGAGYCRNIGIKNAKGLYLWFIDGDDYIEESAICVLEEYINKNEIDVLWFDLKRIDDNGERINYLLLSDETDILKGEDLYCKLSKGTSRLATACSSIYRRKYVWDKKILFREGAIGEDAFFSMYALINAFRSKYIRNSLYVYHKSQSSVTTDTENYKRFIGFFLAYCDMLQHCYLENKNTELQESILKTIAFYYRVAKINFGFDDIEKIDLYMEQQSDFVLKRYRLFKKVEYGEFYIKGLDNSKLEIIKEEKNIIIYGAGNVAKEFALLINKLEKRIISYAVSDMKGNPKSIYGVPVTNINDLIEYKENALIVIATLSDQAKGIEHRLKELEFKKFLKLFD